MRVVGVEPTRLAAQEPKSCASANSAKAANMHLLHYRVSMNEMQEGLAVIESTGVAQYSSTYLHLGLTRAQPSKM